jgi:hypothetical protein
VREETRARLEAIMTRYEKRLAETRKRQELTRRRHDAFVVEFERLIEETIRPTMVDVGAALRGRGHDYEISMTQGYTDVDKQTHNTQITMRVYPSGIQRSLFTSTSTPFVAFVSDWLETRVTVQESTFAPASVTKTATAAGRSGRRAVFLLKQVTAPVVEREIVEVLAGIFGRDRVPDRR